MRTSRVSSRRFVDLPLRTKGIIVIAVPLTLLLASLGSVLWADWRSRAAEDQVRTTLEIQSGILEIRALLEEASTGVRGYLLTREANFLQPYTRAKLEMPAVLERMERSIADAEQKMRMERIKVQIARKFERLEEIRNASTSNATGLVDLKQALINGKRDLDLLRVAIRDMTAREEKLLQERAGTAEDVRSRSRILMIVAGLFGLLGAITAVMLFSAGIVRRVHSLEKQAHRLSNGEPVLIEDNAKDEIGVLEHALRDASVLLKKRETDLRESEERFRLVVEGVRDYGIFALDAAGRVTSWNAGAQRITGYTASEATGRHFSIFYPPETRETLPGWELEEAKRSGRVENEGTRVRKDGSQFQSHTIITALQDDQGRPRGFSKVTRDITERKRFEDEILCAREDALRASQAKSEFLSRISHELRTPLNSILGFAQVLELDVEDPEQYSSIAQILRAGRHLLSLINEVLDIARIESGRMDLEFEAVGVNETISQAVSLAAPLAEARKIKMVCENSGLEAVAVRADRRRLLQVVLNLLSNAIKYNREGGEVEITAKLIEGGQIKIAISDNGIGIPQELVPRLFTPFERLGIDNQGTEGTGLGLALSKHLVEAMHGVIGLDAKAGHGSTFFICLPLADQLTQDIRVTSNLSLSARQHSHGERLILYVEDNLANLALVEKLVARRSDRLLPSMQGRMAITLAIDHRPDLILLDLNLPDISGLEVLRALKKDMRTHHIPVIMVSADPSATSQEMARQSGAVRYLAKPLEVVEFMRTLDEVL
jgi:PAS domain S-box-containing protein